MNGVTAGQGGHTKKKKHRGGKSRKRPKPAPTPEPEPSADSISGAEGGSESSVHGYYAAIEKVTGKLR